MSGASDGQNAETVVEWWRNKVWKGVKSALRLPLPDIPTEKLNAQAVERMARSRVLLMSVGRALETIPRMRSNMILHPGPPITWERMSMTLQGAVVGALLYEGIAETEEQARDMSSRGRVMFEPCQDHHAVCPQAAVISPSMPVCIVKNETYNNFSYCTLNEGPGRVLRYGAFKTEAIERLKWIEKTLAPVFRQAIAAAGRIDLSSIMSQAVQMADDLNQQTRAATALFVRTLAPHMVRTCPNREMLAQILSFVDSHNPFFQNLAMAAAKSAVEAAQGIPGSGIVTVMGSNGTDFGIQISGLESTWFVAPIDSPDALYLPGYSKLDAQPAVGDGAVLETCGLGAAVLAGAPANIRLLGRPTAEALRTTEEMYAITAGESLLFTIPALDMRGAPLGVDVQKVAAVLSPPWLYVEVIHRQPGLGPVGACLWQPPLTCFEQAAAAIGQEQG